MTAYDHLEVFTRRATETDVLVEVQGDAQVRRIQLTGPQCTRARTLPTTFSATAGEPLLVTDPCYWSPQMPFLYDAVLEEESPSGSIETCQQTLGLTRWDAEGQSLFRERRRVVLRGAVVDQWSEDLLSAAVTAEMALVVRDPEDALLQRASELGVPLVVDLRGQVEDLSSKLRRCTWQPAVAVVLLEETEVPMPCVLKTGWVGDCSQDEPKTDWADVLVVELDADELPPAWAASCEQPVIAIRRQRAYADLQEARRGCDRLQAELAPQFDLAGYVV